MDRIRNILKGQYGLTAESRTGQCARPGGRLFAMANSSRVLTCSQQKDEVDLFYEFTSTEDSTCTDVIQWWATIGRFRFPKLAMLARDVLMTMGSSVPSESGFSHNGDYVHPDRSRLTDENIGMMMKVRSWNRLLTKL